MRAEGTGQAARWTITEKSETPRFILRLTRLVADEPESTPAQQIDAYVKAMMERPVVEGSTLPAFEVRERRSVQVDGAPAGIIYATLREDDGLAGVRGDLIIHLGGNQFIVVNMLMSEEDAPDSIPLLERAFATIRLQSGTDVLAMQMARLERGDDFLRHLDEDALRTALDQLPTAGITPTPRWYRMARRLPDGREQEVGYLTLLVTEGPQGAANPSRAPEKWSPAEREQGLLVRLQMRLLLDETGTGVVDTDARYWVRWDRQREFWTNRTTQRRGRHTRSSSQLGVREAPTAYVPRPELHVADTRPSGVASEPRVFKVPEIAYLSVAEALVLPRLLVCNGTPGEYGFNWFDPSNDRPGQRRDVLERTPNGYTLVTRPTLLSPPTTQTLGPRGELLRQESDDGSFTQAIEPQALLKLWKQKGLPTGE